jgi:spermidine synthase
LSHREPSNHYTYVDIDPAVREIAERHFLHETANAATSSPTTPAAS